MLRRILRKRPPVLTARPLVMDFCPFQRPLGHGVTDETGHDDEIPQDLRAVEAV